MSNKCRFNHWTQHRSQKNRNFGATSTKSNKGMEYLLINAPGRLSCALKKLKPYQSHSKKPECTSQDLLFHTK